VKEFTNIWIQSKTIHSATQRQYEDGGSSTRNRTKCFCKNRIDINRYINSTGKKRNLRIQAIAGCDERMSIEEKRVFGNSFPWLRSIDPKYTSNGQGCINIFRPVDWIENSHKLSGSKDWIILDWTI